jgi:predicted nucleic acid-binding protein
MRTVFVDATFYIALLVSRDSNRSSAKALAQSWTGSVITTDYVLTEVANHLSTSSRGRTKFGRLLANLRSDANTLIVGSTHDLWERGVARYCSVRTKNGR